MSGIVDRQLLHWTKFYYTEVDLSKQKWKELELDILKLNIKEWTPSLLQISVLFEVVFVSVYNHIYASIIEKLRRSINLNWMANKLPIGWRNK